MTHRLLLILLFTVLTTTFLLGHTVGVETDKASGPLNPGEFYWRPQLSTRGPVVLVVSLPRQMMVVYRNGIQIARSSISSGAGQKATPTGVYEILQKRTEHYSNIYNNAPMPYMQRLTWSGIALHAGQLPGYPASKGCIRLPYEFSKRLYDITKMGGMVVIANDKSPNARFVSNPSTVLAAQNQPPEMLRQLSHLDYQWNPEASPEGPVAILVSGADRNIYIYRNGILIGRSSFLRRSDENLGEHIYTLLNVAPGDKKSWMEVDPREENPGITPQQLRRLIRVSLDFFDKLSTLVAPGLTVIITDEPALRDSKLNIITTD